MDQFFQEKYPLFAASFLSLIDDIHAFAAAGFAGYVAVLICSGWILGIGDAVKRAVDEKWTDEELDMRIPQGRSVEQRRDKFMGDREVSPVDGLDQVLPSPIVSVISDILLALLKLQVQHMSERGGAGGCLVSDTVLDINQTLLAKVERKFAAQEKWCDGANVIKCES